MPTSRHNRVQGRDRTEKRHRAALRRSLRKAQTHTDTEKIRKGETVYTDGVLGRVAQKLGWS